MTVQTIEKDLTVALYRLSWGKLTLDEAKAKAHEVAPKFDAENEMLMHKGVNWYAKKLLAVM